MKLTMGKKFWWPLAIGTVAALLAWHLLGQYRENLELHFTQLADAQKENIAWVDVVVPRAPLRAGDMIELHVLQYRRIDASLLPHGVVYPDQLEQALGRFVTIPEGEEIPQGSPLQWYQLSAMVPTEEAGLPVDHTLITLSVNPEDSHIGLWEIGDFVQVYQRTDSVIRKLGNPYQIYALDGTRQFELDDHLQAPRYATLLVPITDALLLASAAIHGPFQWVLVHSDEGALPTKVAPPHYIQRILPKGEACIGVC